MGWYDGEATGSLADEAETDVDIEYRYSPGSPGTPPSFSYPGDPPEGPEVEIVAVYRLGTRERIEVDEAEETRLIQYLVETEDLDGLSPDDWD